MSYLALYRAYRPKNFSDVVGQQHIVTVLKNQVENQRIAHAYLFSGPRGTGKTSIAKIFAKAINCQNLQDSEPCEKCEVCLQVASDTCIDIIEIDAASNNGVDNIRDIREKAALLPTSAKYKVYIIDEVHMLSQGAFNALLKTLEEPPPHVIFILATTEPKKIPATIHSRCQRYDFKRLSVDDIVERLKFVASEQNIDADEEALTTIARSAMGGMRDALSILDQCISSGQKLTSEVVLNILGGASRHEILELMKYITSYDEKSAIIKLEQIKDSGADIKILLKDLAYNFKGMLFLMKGADANSAGIPKQDAESLLDMGNNFKEPCVQRALEVLIANEPRLSTNSFPEIVLQLSIIQMMNQSIDNEATSDTRLTQLEAKLEQLKKNGIELKPAGDYQNIGNQDAVKSEPTTKQQTVEDKTDSSISSKGDVKHNESDKKRWERLLAMISKKSIGFHTHLTRLKFVGIDDNTIYLKTDYVMSYNYTKSNMDVLKEYVNVVYEKDMKIDIEHKQTQTNDSVRPEFPSDMFGDIEVKEI